MPKPSLVFAYLDPGTGSYLLQMALAGMLGASYAVKHFWSRIRRRLLGRQVDARADDPQR